MSRKWQCILVTQDFGLQAHWQNALKAHPREVCNSFVDLSKRSWHKPTIVWLDCALPGLPAWDDPQWFKLTQSPGMRLVATASNPRDEAAIAALGAGCAGYCHAFAGAATLRQVAQVVEAGHVWIGPTLMHRLIQGANHAADTVKPNTSDWSASLTPREVEIANLAAKGSSNQQIADICGITERTVKAHLSAIFEKLQISDRLQLALKVHGIAQ